MSTIENNETNATKSDASPNAASPPGSPGASSATSTTSSTSLVDTAFDAGTRAVVDVLAFTREALHKSAVALEESAKKIEALTTALKP